MNYSFSEDLVAIREILGMTQSLFKTFWAMNPVFLVDFHNFISYNIPNTSASDYLSHSDTSQALLHPQQGD